MKKTVELKRFEELLQEGMAGEIPRDASEVKIGSVSFEFIKLISEIHAKKAKTSEGKQSR